MPKLKPLNKNVILKGITKRSPIVLSDDANQQYRLEKLVVEAVGDEVTKVKVGDQVEISLMIFQDKSRLIKIDKQEPKDGEFYSVVEEGEIIGVYK